MILVKNVPMKYQNPLNDKSNNQNNVIFPQNVFKYFTNSFHAGIITL